MLIKTQVGRFMNRIYQSAGGLWSPLQDLLVPKNKNVIAVLGTPFGKQCFLASNIITNAGDVYYAQSAAGESVTNNFNSLYLSSVDWGTGPSKTSTSSDIASMISGTEKTPTSTYPKTNDADSDNTGAGTDIVTWLFSYAKGDFTDADIDAGAISIASVTWGSGGTVLLTGFDIGTPFGKTSNDTLKFFVNHTVNGV